MRSFIASVIVAAALSASVAASAQGFGDIVNQAKQLKDKGSQLGLGNKNISNQDAVTALRDALKVGAQNASSKLSATNGYFGNALIKIPMPPEAAKVERTLRGVGLGEQVDKAILSMNRAAEDAAKKAAPIFIDAIKGMTIQDGISIVRGGNDAATQYLKGKTNMALTNAFRPVIKDCLDKVQATKYWSQVFTAYNKMPFVSKVNPDLEAYVTERALNGLFVTIAQEEAKIRTDPAAQVTDMLRKVFGTH